MTPRKIPEHQRSSLQQKAEDLKEISPGCGCLAEENGPYYVHLGHAESKEKLRTDFEEKLNVSGSALRMFCVRFTGKEGTAPSPSGSSGGEERP